MKSGEEILAEFTIDRTKPLKETLALVIESAQREAWNEAVEKAAKWALNFHIAPAPRSRAAQFHERNVKAILHDAIRSLHREEG